MKSIYLRYQEGYQPKIDVIHKLLRSAYVRLLNRAVGSGRVVPYLSIKAQCAVRIPVGATRAAIHTDGNDLVSGGQHATALSQLNDRIIKS